MRSLRAARLFLAMILVANGVVMLAFPQPWYDLLPGVSATGALNTHFVRDIGAAYLISGAGFFWLWCDERAWRAAMAGSGFLVLHALIHIGEMLGGAFDLNHLLRDLGGVFLVPAAALYLARPSPASPSIKEHPHAEMDCTTSTRPL